MLMIPAMLQNEVLQERKDRPNCLYILKKNSSQMTTSKTKNQKKWGEEKKGQCNKLKNREPNKQLTNKDNNSCD